MKAHVVFLCLAVPLGSGLSAFCVTAAAQETNKSEKRHDKYVANQDLWWQLLAGSDAQSVAAFRWLKDSPGGASTLLLPYAKKLPEHEVADWRRRAIILVLARCQTHASMRFLASEIDLYLPTPDGGFEIEQEVLDHPCALALIDTGLSSVPWILEHLEDAWPADISDKAIRLYARVLLYVYVYPKAAGGAEEAIAVVERAKNRAPQEKRANHDRLLAKLRELAKKPRWVPGKR